MVTSWYDTQQCRSGLHKSGANKLQREEGSRIIWTAAQPPDRVEEIKSVMAGLSLAPKPPRWATTVPESVWKDTVLRRAPED